MQESAQQLNRWCLRRPQGAEIFLWKDKDHFCQNIGTHWVPGSVLECFIWSELKQLERGASARESSASPTSLSNLLDEPQTQRLRIASHCFRSSRFEVHQGRTDTRRLQVWQVLRPVNRLPLKSESNRFNLNFWNHCQCGYSFRPLALWKSLESLVVLPRKIAESKGTLTDRKSRPHFYDKSFQFLYYVHPTKS